MANFTLTAASTALIMIDLQQAIVARELAPHSAATVMSNARRIAEKLRGVGGTVVFVRVDVNDMAQLTVDSPSRPPGSPPPPPGASELSPDAGFKSGDLLITKKQWGAFYGTELELQLRRRKITTILLGGIATNFGVESTARDAAERSFEQVFIEDAMATVNAEAHAFPMKYIFPRLGRVRSTEDVLRALA